MIFWTETKCKIRFIYVGFNCKKKKWGKKCLEIMSIGGDFDFLKPSLSTHAQVWLELEEGEVYEPSHSRRGYASFNGHRLA